MVYVNTLLVQKELLEKEWLDNMQSEDFRGLAPLFYSHVTPYGKLSLKPDLESEKQVLCEHCGETYKEKEIKWDTVREMWVCKNHPKCDGSVLQLNIRHID